LLTKKGMSSKFIANKEGWVRSLLLTKKGMGSKFITNKEEYESEVYSYTLYSLW